MLLRYFLSDFEMVPVAPIVTGITFSFTFHMRWIYVIIIIIVYYFMQRVYNNMWARVAQSV